MDNEEKKQELIALRQRAQLFKSGNRLEDMLLADKEEYENMLLKIKLLEDEING